MIVKLPFIELKIGEFYSMIYSWDDHFPAKFSLMVEMFYVHTG